MRGSTAEDQDSSKHIYSATNSGGITDKCQHKMVPSPSLSSHAIFPLLFRMANASQVTADCPFWTNDSDKKDVTNNVAAPICLVLLRFQSAGTKRQIQRSQRSGLSPPTHTHTTEPLCHLFGEGEVLPYRSIRSVHVLAEVGSHISFVVASVFALLKSSGMCMLYSLLYMYTEL